MKCIVVSDNHRDRTSLLELYQHYAGQSVVFFHCGDSELAYDDPIWQQTVRVTGNCDFDYRYPNEELVADRVHTILLTHGHRHHVNTSHMWLVEQAKCHRATVVFYGHTHLREASVYDQVLCLNPGSIAYPRGRFHSEPSYAVVDIDRANVHVTYFSPDHQEIAGWTKTFKFNEKDGSWL